ncbi:MAG: orotate phosphoribosyltransferase [Burkholderiales bacterium]|nr:orotate phosphoribosyltransferase [Burkholderiales bacterium]
MDTLRQQFIEFALRVGVLRFGEFTTKAGRKSPYFFNTGLFDTGAKLGALAGFYARTLLEARAAGRVRFDMLFGPAYKGITLASATAVALAGLGHDVPFAFNRKEAKDHGEGGSLVGAPLKGRVVIVDDVVTNGAAKREAIALLSNAGAEPAGVLIAFDRMERAGPDDALSARSAVQELETLHGLPVIAIANLDDLLAFANSSAPAAEQVRAYLPAMQSYRDHYGA